MCFVFSPLNLIVITVTIDPRLGHQSSGVLKQLRVNLALLHFNGQCLNNAKFIN